MSQNLETRRRYVDWALSLTIDTALAPSRFERLLLEHYVAGEVSLDEAVFLSDSYRRYQNLSSAQSCGVG